MASSCSPSSSNKSPPPPPHLSPCFPLIEECENNEGKEKDKQEKTQSRATPDGYKKITSKHQHQPTPLHHTHKNSKHSVHRRRESDEISQTTTEDDGSVSCNKCRPHSREKITVVPLDNNGLSKSIASPNKIFKSILSSLTRKSPKPSSEVSSTVAREEHWKIAVAELSHKLIQATRRRDEALLEASRLKYSMAELEKKLNKLEVYCYNLKSGLEECNSSSPHQMVKNQCSNTVIKHQQSASVGQEKVIEDFLVTVSEARTAVRILSRSLTMQLRNMGSKVYERITLLLQPYDVRIAFSKNPRSLLGYLEALLNRVFFEDFETPGFEKSSGNAVLNPIDRCEANYTSFNALQALTWEDVLNKGTRHFCEEFSGFCDRKMSEIVAMLGWNRAWPEPLLQAFFGASKDVWLVHLLATSVHPGLPIFRVDKGVKFDSVYMEDMGGDKAGRLVPAMVRIMVAPGFYVYDSVVKCKVLCRYHSTNVHIDDKVSTLSPY